MIDKLQLELFQANQLYQSVVNLPPYALSSCSFLTRFLLSSSSSSAMGAHPLLILPMDTLPLLARSGTRYIIISYFVIIIFFITFAIDEHQIGFNCFIVIWLSDSIYGCTRLSVGYLAPHKCLVTTSINSNNFTISCRNL